MSIFYFFRNVVIECVQDIAKSQSIEIAPELLNRIVAEPPKDAAHGDIAVNAAMILSKHFKTSPQVLAGNLVEKLSNHPHIEHAEIAGPGFINIKLTNARLFEELSLILEKGESYGNGSIGNGEKVIVEFVSANPTGPIHAGHGRNAILGDAIASLFSKVGFQVSREYYINDAGGQIVALAQSVYLRYKQALGHTIQASDFDGDLYPGDYLIPIAQDLANQYGDQLLNLPEQERTDIIRRYAVTAMMQLIQKDLELLGVHMNEFRSEKELADAKTIDQTLAFLEKHGDIYQGVLEKPKGHQADDWEEREQTLFRATKYGDDTDRVIKKSNGSWTYFAGDIAYHYDKWKRGFKNMVNVFGADHSGYVKRLKSAVSALTDGQANFEIKVSQMVNFMDNGVPVRMSKRAGTFITVSDVIDRVGVDVTRFLMVSRHNDMALDFDFAKVVEQSKDNPIFYIQYAHARIHSVKRHAEQTFSGILNKLSQADIAHLNDSSEWLTIKVMADWPRQIELATITREPHRIANYLYHLASTFHSLWNKGKENNELRFIDTSNEAKTITKLALIQCVALIIADGLKILGIKPVEEMRA